MCANWPRPVRSRLTARRAARSQQRLTGLGIPMTTTRGKVMADYSHKCVTYRCTPKTTERPHD